VLTRPLRLKPGDRKPQALGPKVRVEAAHLSPPGDESGLRAVIGGVGLTSRDGFKVQDTNPAGMWRQACQTNLSLEFELPETVPLSAVEVWNFNAEWRTTDGVRKADVAVSSDGKNWRTVLRGVEIAEAEGTPDYDEPTVLKLEGVTARLVRFENLVPRGANGQIGLSKVVFHAGTNSQAAPLQPEDAATGVSVGKTALAWVPGQGTVEHRVFLGASPGSLALLGTTREARFDVPDLKPNTAYFWRVDEAQKDGSVVTGRLGRFDTVGLVAHWKLDAKEGNVAEDTTGHQLAGRVQGEPHWAPGQGPAGGALEFDGLRNFIQCGNSPEFEFRDALTISVWLKVRKFDKNWQAIVSKGDHSWRLQRNAGEGKVRFVAAGPKSTQPAGAHWPFLISKRSLDDGQWHHVVGLYDGRRVALFVDGELDDSLAASGPMVPDSQPVLIGENSEERGRRFNGWMADVRLYGYGLSDEEVRSLYREGRSAATAAK
jgi:hypothetical protein